MSLLQDVLRTQTLDTLDKTLGLSSGRSSPPDRFEDEDELINVISLPGTPSRSRAPSRPASRPSSRANSPTRSGSRSLRPLTHLSPPGSPQRISSDPLKAFPTELSQRIFSRLSVKDLASCSRVSRKWNKSQTLNYVWFQHYRKENFHDDSLPPGKWTKRESKQNWRTTYLNTIATRSPSLSGMSSPSRGGGSGYQTPREIREERWRSEVEAQARPSKTEMREMYKELGGRKSKGKPKVGSFAPGAGVRDRGGWGEDHGEGW